MQPRACKCLPAVSATRAPRPAARSVASGARSVEADVNTRRTSQSPRPTLQQAVVCAAKKKTTKQPSLEDTNGSEVCTVLHSVSFFGSTSCISQLPWVAKLACETRTLHRLELNTEEQSALEIRCMLSNVAYGVRQQGKVLKEAQLLLNDTRARLQLMEASCMSHEASARAWLAAAEAAQDADAVMDDIATVAA